MNADDVVKKYGLEVPGTDPADAVIAKYGLSKPTRGVLRTGADVGLSLAEGVVTGGRMVAEAAGADNTVSRGLERVAKGLGGMRSAVSQAQDYEAARAAQEAAGKGFKAETAASIKSFAKRPGHYLAQAVGTSVPTLAAIALTRGRVNPLVAGGGVGAVMGAGETKGSIYESVYREALDSGKTEDEARAIATKAQSYTGKNLDNILAGTGIGALAGTTGIERAFGGALARKAAPGAIKNMLRNGATEAGTEYIQEGHQGLAGNIAAQREGYHVPTMEGVYGQAAHGALAGFAAGGLFGAGESLVAQPPATRDPTVDVIGDEAAGAQQQDAEQKLLGNAGFIATPNQYESNAEEVQAAEERANRIYAERDAFEAQKAQGHGIDVEFAEEINIGPLGKAASLAKASGSFKQLGEFAEFLEQEKADIEKRRDTASAEQAARQNAEATLRMESDLETADARVADADIAKRNRQKLADIDAAMRSDNPMARFAELRSDRGESALPIDVAIIKRRMAQQEVFKKDLPPVKEKSLPDEGMSNLVKERTLSEQTKPKDKGFAHIDLALRNGFVRKGNSLVHPKTGKKVNLNADEKAYINQQKGATDALQGQRQEAAEAVTTPATPAPVAKPADVPSAQTATAPAKAEASKAEAIDYETFAAQRGYSRQSIGDAGLHRSSERKSPKTHRQQVEAQSVKDAEIISKRAELQNEYDDLVNQGKLRPLTEKERVLAKAKGHPDNESVQSARRIADKRGWEWRDTVQGAKDETPAVLPEGDQSRSDKQAGSEGAVERPAGKQGRERSAAKPAVRAPEAGAVVDAKGQDGASVKETKSTANPERDQLAEFGPKDVETAEERERRQSLNLEFAALLEPASNMASQKFPKPHYSGMGMPSDPKYMFRRGQTLVNVVRSGVPEYLKTRFLANASHYIIGKDGEDYIAVQLGVMKTGPWRKNLVATIADRAVRNSLNKQDGVKETKSAAKSKELVTQEGKTEGKEVASDSEKPAKLSRPSQPQTYRVLSPDGKFIGTRDLDGKQARELKDRGYTLTPWRLSRGGKGGITTDTAKSISEAFVKAHKGSADIKVVANLEAIKDSDLYKQIAARGALSDVEGASYKGDIYLFPQNLESDVRAAEVLMHEGRHFALAAIKGEGLNNVMTGIYKSNPLVRNAADAKKKSLGLKDIAEATEEVLADMDVKQLRDLKGWPILVAHIKAKVREMAKSLDKAGFINAASWMNERVNTWTDADVARLLKDADTLVTKPRAVDAAGDDDAKLQRVWHGTPHVWAPEPGFPHGRPRLDKIGTGEGAQSYGWGWYSAEDEAVGVSYKDVLTARTPRELDVPEPKNIIEQYAIGRVNDRLRYGNKTPEQAIKEVILDARNLRGANNPAYIKQESSIASYLENLWDTKPQIKERSGLLYQLDIPDATLPYLLDWDKPLSEQTPEVKKALEFDVKRKGLGQVDDGKFIYRQMGRDDKSRSEYLSSLGIVGNRYLDGQSRKDGDGTYNYVIWDQPTLDKIAMLERNGEKLDAIREADARLSRKPDLSSEYEIPSASRNAIATPIDGAKLRELRRAAAGIESPDKGITFRVDEEGRAIVTGPARTKVPTRFQRFANENGLTLVVRRGPVDNVSPGRMPDAYRESGALYFGEMGQQGIDRTGKTRFSRTSNFRVVKAGDKVDGRTVREHVPNMGSIASSLDDYTVLPGLREVPMSAFDKEYVGGIKRERLDARTKKLADEIEESGEINPLIVVIDADGAYVLEGGHRYDALIASGAKSIPAVVVRDNESRTNQDIRFSRKTPKTIRPAWLGENGEVNDSVRIDPTLKAIAKGGLGMFESATDRLRRSGAPILIDLADKIDRYYDQAEARLGKINGKLRPVLKEIRKNEKANMADFEEYWRAHDNGREAEAKAILDRNPLVKKLVDVVQDVFDDTGSENQNVDTPFGKGMKVFDSRLVKKDGDIIGRIVERNGEKLVYKDGELVGTLTGTSIKLAEGFASGKADGTKLDGVSVGGYRTIGKFKRGEFWPRAFRADVQAVLQNPSTNLALWNEIVDALIDGGYIQNRSEAIAFRNDHFSNESSNDFFAGIEMARGLKLPEQFYDYSYDAFLRYAHKWSTRISQAEQFGQVTQPGQKDAFENAMSHVLDYRTKNYIKAAADIVYTRRNNTLWTNIISHLNLLATGLQLGNWATATLNLIGGTTLNVQHFGLKNTITAFREMAKDWENISQKGTELGILNKDYLRILQDNEIHGQYDIHAVLNQKLSKFAAFTLKWGGYTGTEHIIRTTAMLAARTNLVGALRAWNKEPGGHDAKKYREHMERNRIDVDKLIKENGEGTETARYLRLMVNIPQGSYRIDQVPIYLDTVEGRFLFKYQKFATQVTRMFWQQILQPFVDSIKEGKSGRERAEAFIPVARFFSAAIIGGSGVLLARSTLFGMNDPGDDLDDIAKAFENDDTAKAWAMIAGRAHANMIAAAGYGMFGNYIQMTLDVADQQRVKNPLTPPGVAPINAIVELLTRGFEQGGRVTMADMDQIAERTFALYRTARRGAATASNTMGIEGIGFAELEQARRDTLYIRKVARNFAEDYGIEAKRTMTGRIGRTERSPENLKIYEAIMLGDAERARLLIKDALDASDDKKMRLQSIRSAVQSRHPVQLGAAPASRIQVAQFRKWAHDNLPESKVQRIEELITRYDRTAKMAGL